jgi:hypothetical protein
LSISRSERASLGGRARAAKVSPERLSEIGRAGARGKAAKIPLEKRRALLDAHIEQIVARAPDLSAEQRDRLRAIFAPVASEEAGRR